MGNSLKRKLYGESPGDQNVCRVVVPNHLIPDDKPPGEHPNRHFLGNRIKTTKYTTLSFLPKNLFEQFHRFANLYFLFIVLLNWVPQVQAVAKELAMIPVVFVLAVTAIKDGFEDYRRYRMDKRINHQPCRVFARKEKRYVRREWAELRAGDIVHLSCNEVIPADIILLRSSDIEHGLCHIDTSNLDGENNLKQRQVVKGLYQGDEFVPSMFTHTIECEKPNMEIYKFTGCMVTHLGEKIPVNKNNILLRGCIIRNTDFVEGIVVYAGHDTKALLNNRGPRYKRSKLERRINKDVIWCVIWLLIMCLVCSLGSGFFAAEMDRKAYALFYFPEYSAFYTGFIRFWTYIILFQVMIPLSLYVSIELVKLGQVYFIHQDVHLFHDGSNKSVECRALNITEDLGQVEMIFSDKTGTLTENQMVFKKCNIGGIDYCTDNGTVVGEDACSKNTPSSSLYDRPDHNQSLDETHESNTTTTTYLTESHAADATLQQSVSMMTLNSATGGDVAITTESRRIQEFFLLMAICNTVVVSASGHHDKMDASGVVHEESSDAASSSAPAPTSPTKKYKRLDKHKHSKSNSTPSTPSGVKSPNYLSPDADDSASVVSQVSSTDASSTVQPDSVLSAHYEAESPDELALVNAACLYGCKLLARGVDHVKVWLPGEGAVKFQVLHVLPFESHRKRMSVIVEHPNTKEIILYCKGADSAIFQNLRPIPPGDEEEQKSRDNTMQHLTLYAKDGLRTLCMAKRVLTSEEYKSWLTIHETAETAFEHRERLLYESACNIETNLELMGTTGIEDKLQDGVPDTIASLRRAGISVWVLTGDKQETALNIAYSCHLISFEQDLIVLNAKNRENARDLIVNHISHLEDLMQSSGVSSDNAATAAEIPGSSKVGQPRKDLAIVIDGRTLAYALDQKLENEFLKLTQFATSVLCCRATPFQKAAVVKLARDKLKRLTLAIGDGANDVSMIQTADVGVGISGQEGMQAVMASDFALPRFRFLKRLLLVHGHWCYDRLARMTLYMFYKNAVFIFMLLWFQIYNGFSGGAFVDDFNLIFFNLVYTALPPIVYGVVDKCVPDEKLMQTPHLYQRGVQGKVYRWYSYHVTIFEAIYQSIVQFYIPYFAYYNSNVDMWEFGVTANAGCVYVSLLHLCVETRYWHPLSWGAIILSGLVFILTNVILGVICVQCSPPANPYWVMEYTLGTPIHWITVVLVIVVSLLPRYLYFSLRGSLWPNACERAQLKQPDTGFFATFTSSSGSSVVLRRHTRLHDVDIRVETSDSTT